MNVAELPTQLREIFFFLSALLCLLPLLSFSFMVACSGLQPAATSSCPLGWWPLAGAAIQAIRWGFILSFTVSSYFD